MDLHSDYPFWMIKEGIMRSYPSLRDHLKTQVLIIGGGITGALIAQRMAAEGLQVTVVDKRHIAHGSTSASTSMLQYEVDVPLFELTELVGEKQAARAYQLCSEAIDRVGELAKPFRDQADFKKYPSVIYASFEKHTAEIIEPEFKARKKHGFEVERWGPKDFQKRFGFSAPSGIHSAQGGQVNPYKLCNYLFGQVLQDPRNQVFDRTRIMEWDPDKKSVYLRTYEGYEIEAEHVVVACGYETQEYVPKKVTQFNSSYAIVSKPFDQKNLWWKNALIWETKTPYLYMRTTGDNRVLIGGRDEEFRDPERRDQLITLKRVQLEQDFKRLFPDIPFETDFAWAGTFAETKDGLPYIGTYDHPRVHFAMGYGGNGIVFSVVAADIICDEIQGRKNKDRSIFTFER